MTDKPESGEVAALIDRIVNITTDWNGARMVDGEEPRIIPTCGELRKLADALARLSAPVPDKPSIKPHSLDWFDPEGARTESVAQINPRVTTSDAQDWVVVLRDRFPVSNVQRELIAQCLESLAAPVLEPIPMVLHCPQCSRQHIDAPQPEKEWDNPPHRSHECQFCGLVWRPADLATTGVQATQTQGARDAAPVPDKPETALMRAAKAVVWFDWSDSDQDAVAAIAELRRVVEAAPTQECRHRWITRRSGGSLVEADSDERVTYCDICGEEPRE